MIPPVTFFCFYLLPSHRTYIPPSRVSRNRSGAFPNPGRISSHSARVALPLARIYLHLGSRVGVIVKTGMRPVRRFELY